MNNHEGQKLTPSIAEQLIIELFIGQTAQLQDIKTKVDEVHVERGGLPSTARTHHPVTLALSKMKRSGLVENPQLGVWSIPIKTLDDFIKWAKKFKEDEYVFRGVRNEVHEIQASAVRRPDEDERSDENERPDEKKRKFEKFLYINKDLIRKAKQRGYNRKDGTELNVLDILAELQHFGSATCLIDFTYSAQTALWFACQPDSKKQEESDGSENIKQTINGKVYAVKHKPPRLSGLPKIIEITPEFLEEDAEKKKDIGYFLKEEKISPLYYLQPKHQNHRIIAQQSVFLFGQYEFEADAECVIVAKCKKDILKELHRVSSITDDKLFPDFAGFAWVQREQAPYTEPTPSVYKELGLEENNNGNYNGAIGYYDIAINRDSNDAEVYNLRGRAHFSLKRYNEALEDFDKAITLKSDYAEAFFSRGELHEQRELYEDAHADFNEAIRIKPDYGEAYYKRGKTRFYLGLYEEALTDFNEAIQLRIDYEDAYFSRGLLKYHFERYEDALEDLNVAIKLISDNGVSYFLRGRVKCELELYDPAILDFDKALDFNPDYVEALYYRAQAKVWLEHFNEANQDLDIALEIAQQKNNVIMIDAILDLKDEIRPLVDSEVEDE